MSNRSDSWIEWQRKYRYNVRTGETVETTSYVPLRYEDRGRVDLTERQFRARLRKDPGIMDRVRAALPTSTKWVEANEPESLRTQWTFFIALGVYAGFPSLSVAWSGSGSNCEYWT